MRPRFLNLEDYGLVGNQETCALVGSNGSVDWLTVPYIDSPSICAANLDPDRGGALSVTPVLNFQSIQKYVPNTNVLVTDSCTATREVTVTDFTISHIGLINAALHLGIAKGRGHQGPPPQSEGERS